VPLENIRLNCLFAPPGHARSFARNATPAALCAISHQRPDMWPMVTRIIVVRVLGTPGQVHVHDVLLGGTNSDAPNQDRAAKSPHHHRLPLSQSPTCRGFCFCACFALAGVEVERDAPCSTLAPRACVYQRLVRHTTRATIENACIPPAYSSVSSRAHPSS